MDLACAFRAKKLRKVNYMKGDNLGLNSDTILVIRLPDSQVLKVMSRSVFLVAVLFALPCIESMLRRHSGFHDAEFMSRFDVIDSTGLDLLVRDFVDAGLVVKGDKALIVCPGVEGADVHRSKILYEQGIDLEVLSDLEHQDGVMPRNAFDFVFVSGSVDAGFVDRVVKEGGIVAGQFNNEPSSIFKRRSNYRIVYLERFGSSVVTIKKRGLANGFSSRKLRVCKLAPEVRKAALNGLEDVLLEPPRKALALSKEYLKKIRFLPDLLGDSLKGYSRRVFVNVGSAEENGDVMEWFHQNYPTKNEEFKAYNLKLLPEGAVSAGTSQADVSNWLTENVKEEEYVVMKAEAEVVEEMMERKTICLVDELFLECNNQWQEGEKPRGKRAYWECIALYGRLRDEGVAVHQWWG